MGRILSCNTDTGNLSADAVHKHDTAQAKHKKIGKNVYRPQCHDIFTQSKNRENGNSVVGGVSRNDIIDLLTYGYISQTKDVIAETSISTVIKGEIDMKLISGLHPRLRKAVSFAKHNKISISVIDRLLASSGFLRKQLPCDMKRLFKIKPHPHLCMAYELFYRLRKVFIISEYHEGVDCVIYMKQENFSEAKAINILTQVADGLQHIHQQDIIHRDLHPGCIVVDKNGVVKITDIGLHANLIPLNAKHRSERSRHVYDAPEVIKGHKYISKEGNIYSLGVILYEMLHGSVPFTGYKERLLPAIYDEHLIFDQRISKDVGQFLKKMMHPYPWRRPTAKDVFVKTCTLTLTLDNPDKSQQPEGIVKPSFSPSSRPWLNPLKGRSKSLATVLCGSEPVTLRSRIPDKKVAYALGVEYSEVCTTLHTAREDHGNPTCGGIHSGGTDVLSNCSGIPLKATKNIHDAKSRVKRKTSDECSKNENTIESALSVVPIKHPPSPARSEEYEEDEVESLRQSPGLMFASRPVSSMSDESIRIMNRCVSASTVSTETNTSKSPSTDTPKTKDVKQDADELRASAAGTSYLQGWIDKELHKIGLLANLGNDTSPEKPDICNNNIRPQKEGNKVIDKWLKREAKKADVLAHMDWEGQSSASSGHSSKAEIENDTNEEVIANRGQSNMTSLEDCIEVSEDQDNSDNGNWSSASESLGKETSKDETDEYPTSLTTIEGEGQTCGSTIDIQVSTVQSSCDQNSRAASSYKHISNGQLTSTHTDSQSMMSESRLTHESSESLIKHDENMSHVSPLETAASYKSDRDSSIPSDLGSLEPGLTSKVRYEREDHQELLVEELLPLPPFTEDERVRSFLAKLASDQEMAKHVALFTMSEAAGDELSMSKDGETSKDNVRQVLRKDTLKTARQYTTFKPGFWSGKFKDDTRRSFDNMWSARPPVSPLQGMAMNILELSKVRHGASEFGFTMHPKVQVSSKTESKIRITNSLPHTNCTNCSAQTLQTCGVVPVSFSEGAVARNFSKRPLLFHVHRGQAQRHTPEGTFISNSFADFQSFQPSMSTRNYIKGKSGSNYSTQASVETENHMQQNDWDELYTKEDTNKKPTSYERPSYVTVLPPITTNHTHRSNAMVGGKWQKISWERTVPTNIDSSNLLYLSSGNCTIGRCD